MIKKTAIVIGASSGIGLETAKKFAQNGYNIVATYNNTTENSLKEICDKNNVEFLNLKLDVANKKEIEDVFAKAFASFDYIDSIVFCSGICDQEKLLCDQNNEIISKIIDVNLKGCILCNKEAMKYLIKQKHGSIVNISSIYGIYGGACESAYSASKAGIIGLTKALAQECGQFGVRVNAVAPGFIETRMTNYFDKDEKEEIKNATPLQKLGKPEDVANAAYFLASDDASFVTGQVLEVSGGATKF